MYQSSPKDDGGISACNKKVVDLSDFWSTMLSRLLVGSAHVICSQGEVQRNTYFVRYGDAEAGSGYCQSYIS